MEFPEFVKGYRIAEAVWSLALDTLSRKRFSHVEGVALTALNISGVTEPAEDILVAALAHDLARELPLEDIRRTALCDGIPLASWEKEAPILLHCRASVVLLKREVEPVNDSITEAIHAHTLGRPGMGRLAKILYVADSIEPGRKHLSKRAREALLAMPLETALLNVLRSNVAHLKRKQKEPLPPTSGLLKELEDSIEEI